MATSSSRPAPSGPTLLLLHGLGANASVWRPLLDLLAERWPGRCVAPDLPGHGAAAAAPPYSFGGFAAAAARHVDPDGDVVVLGHSMGGVAALALASGWFRVRPRLVVGFGIKVQWSADDLARALALSQRTPQTYATAEEASERYLRISGLRGLAVPGDFLATAGVDRGDDGWRVAWDPRTAAVGAPPMRSLLSAAACDVVLARGEHDPMVTTAQLEDLHDDVRVVADRGHNAHVEDAAAIAALVEEGGLADRDDR